MRREKAAERNATKLSEGAKESASEEPSTQEIVLKRGPVSCRPFDEAQPYTSAKGGSNAAWRHWRTPMIYPSDNTA
jgi:hypothetical protein